MYVCIYIYIHIYIHILNVCRVSIFESIQQKFRKFCYVCMNVYVCMYVCIYVHICIYILAVLKRNSVTIMCLCYVSVAVSHPLADAQVPDSLHVGNALSHIKEYYSILYYV